MNAVAGMTLRALAAHGVPALPAYRRALVRAFERFPPVFGRRAYADLYRRNARDRDWVALSLATFAEGEGDGAERLWDMAASTPHADVARQLRWHAIDEARHSRGYVTLLGLIFPAAVDEELLAQLKRLSPGYTRASPLRARRGSPYARAATVDEIIQMNLAEMRTRIQHLFQRPVLLAYCPAQQRPRVRRILDSLLHDETRHIAYTARLIERTAQQSGLEPVMELMHERLRDFNELTEAELAGDSRPAAYSY
jgi:rubrerythrin